MFVMAKSFKSPVMTKKILMITMVFKFQIASGQVSFHIDGTSVYLFGVASDVGLTGFSTDATISELLDSMSPEHNKKKKHNTSVVVSYSQQALFKMK